MAAIKQSDIVVVVVPFPAQGHINQLLHLSRLIAAYNIPIHIITTTTHSRQAKSRIHGWDPLSIDTIHFHDYPTPHFSSPPPDPTDAIKFPSQLIPSFKSAMHLRQPFVDLLSTLSPAAEKRVVVIHDYLMGPVVQDVGSFANAEAYMFSCCSAFASFWYHQEATGRPALDGELELIKKELPSDEDCYSSEGLQFILSTDVSYKKFSSGTILDACRVIEGNYIDLLEKENQDHKLWALGPFNPVAITHDSSHKRHKLFDWLEKQEPNSVLYVSFGTTTSISNDQIQEIALGLEKSEQKFIWVLREADKGDIFEEGEVRKIDLPEGFEKRVGENGLVVVDWVPQSEILSHPSTGGFMSHCGWNSSMESITMGVPIAAWPMHSDQPRNAMLITKVLNVGMYVRDWTQRKEFVRSTVVEEVVRRLMASDEGAEMRKRAAELGDRVRRSVVDGGVTRMELDAFVAHIRR